MACSIEQWRNGAAARNRVPGRLCCRQKISHALSNALTAENSIPSTTCAGASQATTERAARKVRANSCIDYVLHNTLFIYV